MKIAVIGASGRTGTRVVAHALARGNTVVSVVRSASRAPHGTVSAIADSRDATQLANAFAGTDAVISCIGQVKSDANPHLLESSAGATIEAMETVGLRRLVVISASGTFVGGDDPLTRFIAKPILNRLLKDNMDDTRALERLLRGSDTEWTAIRPSQLVDREGKKPYRSRLDLSIPWGFRTGYDAVARAALDALTKPEWVGHAVSVVD